MIINSVDAPSVISQALTKIDKMPLRVEAIKIFGTLLSLPGCGLILERLETAGVISQLYEVLFFEDHISTSLDGLKAVEQQEVLERMDFLRNGLWALSNLAFCQDIYDEREIPVLTDNILKSVIQLASSMAAQMEMDRQLGQF